MPEVSRRSVTKGAAWSLPVIGVTAAAPALAASVAPLYDIKFDGGGGSNGFMNSVYINFGTINSTKGALPSAVVVSFNIVGLNASASNYQRSFTVGTSTGTMVRSAYNSTTRTTSFVWTIPAGTKYDSMTNGAIDALVSFGDGLAPNLQRITNKIVVTSVSGVVIASGMPLDSTVVGDMNKSAVSPDGKY